MKRLRHLEETGELLLVHNYIVVEASALLQRRGGVAPAEKLLKDVEGWEIAWIDASLHREARDNFSRLKSAQISFVDCVSFALMRQRKITKAFAFDRHFAQQGFTLVTR